MKRLSLVLIFLSVTAAVCSAVDFDFVVGQTTSASLEFENRSDGMKPKFRFDVDAELDMDFEKGHGMMVSVYPFSEGGSVEFALGVGYAFRTPISSNTDFMFSVGPTLIISSGACGFGVFLDANFDFILTDLMFIRVGTGVELNFGDFGDPEFGKGQLEMIIPLPYIGVGFQF